MSAGLGFAGLEMGDGELVIVLRLLFATVAGLVIGWNRFRAGKPAGAGTHSLVALGSALFVALPAAHGSDTVTRVIQGVAAGVGFLGAGEIFRDPGSVSRVHGLTSAAALWATAALGIIAATASWLIMLASTLLVLVVLELAPRIEHKYKHQQGASEQGGR
jgi:putative Mg2+ transporter-C (MgtC) family protein